MAPDSRTEDAVRGFITGGLVALGLTLVLPSVAQAVRNVLSVPLALAQLLWDVPIPLSMAVGGFVAGRSLGRARRGSVAIGVAMLMASTIQVLALGDVGRLTGRENPLFVITIELAVGIGAFAISGVCAGRLMRTRSGETWRAVAGFAAGGLLGGVAGVTTFLLARIGAGAVLGRGYPFVLLVCQALSILGPFVAIGVALARGLESHSD
jgi:hypothetical protein